MNLREEIKAFVGKTLSELTDAFANKKIELRPMGNDLMGTMDFREDRVNYELDGDAIKDIWVG